MDKDIKDAYGDIPLKQLEIQAIRDNTAMLEDITVNLSMMCDFLEQIEEHIYDVWVKKLVAHNERT